MEKYVIRKNTIEQIKGTLTDQSIGQLFIKEGGIGVY